MRQNINPDIHAEQSGDRASVYSWSWASRLSGTGPEMQINLLQQLCIPDIITQ